MRYFTVETIAPNIWRLRPNQPVSTTALEVLIESLALVFSAESPDKILLVPANAGLKRALTSIGLTYVGTFESEDKFRVTGMPVHELNHDAREYFGYCKARERYMLGISTRNQNPPSSTCLLTSNLWKERRTRSLDGLSALTRSRRSATGFNSLYRATRDEVEAILQDCFYERADGHLPFATAGGYRCIEVFVLCERVDGVKPGLYRVGLDQQWTEWMGQLSSHALCQIGFDQEWAQDCSFWLIPVLSLGASGEKYGARAYRFCLLAAGAFIHQASLSALSFGLGTRILGGFDDAAAQSFCGFGNDPNQMIAAFLGFGKEED